MPKPYFLGRRSGLYVRFLVPLDLREAVGSRFLIRTLGSARGDRARFGAAALAMVLAESFARMRTGVGDSRPATDLHPTSDFALDAYLAAIATRC